MNQDERSMFSWLPWLAGGVALLATMVFGLYVKKVVEQNAISQFAFASDQITLKIRERLDAQELVLRGAAGLIAASDIVSREDWHRYWKALKPESILPGVQGFGFSLAIPPQKLEQHIQQVRGEGFPAYVVKPDGKRDLYTSIIYLEPFRDRNLRAFGYDMFSEPVRRAAMVQARDTGGAALSGKVTLVQEDGQQVQPGVLMYVPVYRREMTIDSAAQRQAALLGWAYSPYRMSDLMHGMLHDWQLRLGKDLHLAVYDGPQASLANRLYSSLEDGQSYASSMFLQQRTIEFNGRQWFLVFDRDPATQHISYMSVWSVATGGVLISCLLFWLSRSLLTTRLQAQRIADKLTRDMQEQADLLKDSEQRFRRMVEQSVSGMFVLRDARFIYANPRFCEITGWLAENLLGQDVLTLMKDDPENLAKVREASSRLDNGERNVSYTGTVSRKDGNTIELGVTATRITWDDGLPATIAMAQDITARKRAEEQIAAYVEQLEGSMRGTLQAIANMVELRDPYTAGHSRRVGLIAGAIAREMGWDEERCVNLELIGLVHDIGKIAVPAEILTRPRRLSALEMELMKMHPQAGYDILKDVPFTAPVAEVILQHHERMNGSGYPKGLRGDEILPEARVLAVADVIESMAAHRPYRAALGLDAALAEVIQGSGKLYDAAAVEAVTRLVKEKAYVLPE